MQTKFFYQQSIINFMLFVIFLLWNWYQPMVADDFVRASLDVLKHGTLFITVYNSYYHWTGRFSAEILADVLFSKTYLKYFIPLINIINSLVLIGILNLLYKFASGKNAKMNKLGLFSLLYLTYFILIGTFAQDFLWKTVAIQYAWGALVLLIVIWKFYLNLTTKENSSWWQILLYALGGIFIGFYNEIYIAFVADLYLSIFIVWLIFKKPLRNLLKIQYFVFIFAVLIAGAISIRAPGNFLRQQTYLLSGQIPHYNILSKFLMTYVQFFRYGYHIVFAFFLVWIGIWTYKSRKILPHNLVIVLTFLFILLNVHILSFVGVAYYSPISGRMLLLMDSIIFFIFLKFFQYKLKPINIKNYNFLFYSVCLMLIIYISIAYLKLNKFNMKREQIIQNNTEKNLSLPIYCANILLKYPVYFDDITEDKNNFKNRALAAYHDRTSIVAGACNE